MREWINNLKIGTRLNLVMGGIVLLVFLGMGFYVSNLMRTHIIEMTDERMLEHVADIAELLDAEVSSNKEKVVLAMNLAGTYLDSKGLLTEVPGEHIEYNAVDQFTGSRSNVRVSKWLIDGTTVQNNFDIVDAIKEMNVETATIFQKIPQGYLRISTNVIDDRGQRAVGTFIPSDNEVARTIDRGATYNGRAWVVNDWYLTAYRPIRINGEVAGMLYVGIPEKNLTGVKEYFDSKIYFDTGYPYIVTADGDLIVHPESEGVNISNEEFFRTMLAHKDGSIVRDEYEWQGEQKVQYFSYYEPIDSFISLGFYTSEMTKIVAGLNITLMLITILAAALVLSVLRFIARSITGGITKGLNIAEQISKGDLTVNIDQSITIQQDEIGQLGRALQLMIEKLRGIIGDIVSGADNISSASTEMSSSSQQMSQGATEQASSAEEVSSSMEEMVSNIQQNTDNAQQTEKIAQNVSSGIKKVGESAGDSLESIRNIASKINIINDIAFQTNILALNAAVEAARAGEHGRGFAVVAAEVRKLAERSKIAADEIVALAAKSVNVTEESGKLMGELIPDIEKTARLVQEITAASLEQNSGADQINNAIQQLNQVIQQNAAVSEEMATTSEELSGQADQLKETVSYFRLETGIKHRKSTFGVKKGLSPAAVSEKNPGQLAGNSKKVIDLKMFEMANDSDFEKY
ncbi:MAG: methyl-accepting chemotaxis protein [Bacteroidales bacterium]